MYSICFFNPFPKSEIISSYSPELVRLGVKIFGCVQLLKQVSDASRSCVDDPI